MEYKLEFMKRERKGITLVALVVTVIVLLILAGVSINLVAGSNGILNRATKAVDVTNMAKIKEDIELKIAEMQMDYYSDNSLRNQYANVNEYIKAELEKGVELPNGAEISCDTTGKLSYEGVEIGTLNQDGSVSIDGELSGSQIVRKYTVSYNANGGQGGPSSARYADGETVTVNFTNIPTQAGCTFLGWAKSADATTPEFTNSGSFTVSGNTILYAVWEYGQAWHAAHPEKHIPTGFSHIEGTVDTGYVIKDSEGNEFVWIPVANDEAYAKKLGTNNYYLKVGSTGYDTAADLGSIANAVKGDKIGLTNIVGTAVNGGSIVDRPEAVVVNKAGGFWVGRYEAGTTANTPETTTTWAEANAKSRVVSKVGVQPVRQINQSQALSIANSWKSGTANTTNGTVAYQSGLITGSQWDAMCNFIGWNTCDSDCSSWGNYANVTALVFTGYTSNHGVNDWVQRTNAVKANSGNAWIFPTGMFKNASNGKTVQKNIYDIAGNVWEWTTEIPQYSETNAIFRGGGALSNSLDDMVSSRHGESSATTFAYYHVGFRLVLYVE